MIAPWLQSPEALAGVGTLLRGSPLPVLQLPGAIDGEARARLREQIAAAGLVRYWIADRGHYSFNDTFVDEELVGELTVAATHLAGTPLALLGARWIRFVAGDYALAKDDRPGAAAPLWWELSLDLSAADSEATATTYVDAQGRLAVVPARAGSVTLVGRHPGTVRFDRYISLRAVGTEIHRLRLALRRP